LYYMDYKILYYVITSRPFNQFNKSKENKPATST